MKLILVRHPQPEIAPKICYGASDLPLQEGALADCLQELQENLPCAPEQVQIFSSPLQRAAHLAQALALSWGQSVRYVDALRELDFGEWELCAWEHIERAAIDAWALDPCNYAPGGGESLLQMTARVLDFVADLSAAQPGVCGEKTTNLLICHAGVMRILHAAQLGGSVAEIAQRAAQTQIAIAYGEWWQIELGEN